MLVYQRVHCFVFVKRAAGCYGSGELSAPKLLKLRLWPDLKEPGKQWASSVVDNGFAAWTGETLGTWMTLLGVSYDIL